MSEFDSIQRIRDLCAARGWSYYRLSKESGIQYSTLNTMLHKTYQPSVTSLERICKGFGITFSEFFSDSEIAALTTEQKKCLSLWNQMDKQSKDLALAYMQALIDKK